MISQTLTIIGAGNMGRAIASGLLAKKTLLPSSLVLTDPHTAGLEAFEKKGVAVTSDNKKAVHGAEIIVLAVKPQAFPEVLSGLKGVVVSDQLVISIAAGIEIGTIKKIFGVRQPVIRVMPNLAATVGESMSCWVKSPEVSKEQEELARELLSAIGKEAELETEDQIDAVTAVSGSGPAYIFYLTEMMEQSAKDLGLSSETAAVLARQTVIGSSKLLAESDKTPKELRIQVTSPGGTTQAAIESFETANLKKIFFNGLRAAYKRAKELSGR